MSEYPREWRVETIGEICKIHDSKRIPLSSEQRRDRKGPYPYYGANNIQDSIDDFIFDFDAVLLAEDGGYYDEYETRDIAQYATGRYWVNNHAHILTGSESLDTRFLYFSLVRKNICPWINTGTRAKLNQADLRQIEIAVPPLPEQKKIAEILSGIDTEIDALSTLISLLTLGKKNLLQDAAEKEPDKFSVKALGEIASVINGYAFSSSDLEDSSNGIPVIRMSNLKSGAVQYETALKIQESKASGLARFLLKKGDLLIGMSGSISNTALVTSEKAALLNQRVGALRANIEGGFYHAIAYQSGIAMRQVEQMAAGGAQLNISSSQIESVEIPVPSRQEMDKITQCWFSIENTIRLYEIKLGRLRSLKNALASDLLSGRNRVSV